jgi:hypothetical protein
MEDGINISTFAEHFKQTGFAANTNLTWIAFNSKYDFAYLLSLFNQLPPTME